MKKHVIVLELDADDHRDFWAEMDIRANRPLPDGDSNTVGACVAEIIRDLWEYRALHDRERQPAAGADPLTFTATTAGEGS